MGRVPVIDLQVVGRDEDGRLLLAAEAGGEPTHRLLARQRVARARPGEQSKADDAPAGAHRREPVGSARGGRERARKRPGDRKGPAAVTSGSEATRIDVAQIQRRLRAGLSVRDVANELDVSMERVARWAEPVRGELARVRDESLAAPVSDGAGGRTTRTLAGLVDSWLPEGLPEDAVSWDVARRRDGDWRLRLELRGRGRLLTATWRRRARGEPDAIPASSRARAISFPDGRTREAREEGRRVVLRRSGGRDDDGSAADGS